MGLAMLSASFPPWPDFSKDEADAVREMILSNQVNYWTGQQARLFEQEFAEFCDCKYGVAVTNGTLALELALRGLGVGSGDEVIVTSRSFIASASSVISVDAHPVFVDIDRDSQNISADTIRPHLTSKTRAILVVHLAGQPADMDPIMALASEHDISVIEDCAQAHGARYKDRPVGSIGHVGAWSFCQEKIMTCGGEGGMITTNDEALWNRCWAYKDHGKSWKAVQDLQPGPHFRWLHESFGSNWRMLEMQAVLGRSQLKKLPEWIEKRQVNASRIRDLASTLPALRVPRVPDDIYHAYYKCYLFLDVTKLADGYSRDSILQSINSHGVPCQVGSCPEIYLEKAFENSPYQPKQRLPVAQELGETSLMFLVHPTLHDEHLDRSCAVIEQVIRQATR